jgi:hypothetical protein
MARHEEGSVGPFFIPRLYSAREPNLGDNQKMKHLLYVLLLVAFAVPGALAQSDYSDHINVGVYGNYQRFGNINLAGVGARVSVNVMPMVQIEAESAYNFDRGFTSGFNNDSNGSVSIATSNLRSLDFLAGPKLYSNKGPVRVFVTVKGGFENYLFSSAPATVGTYTNTFANLNGHRLDAALYPGVGAEAFWGPIGLRLDVGDEMYFDNHTYHNLKIAFGPTIRF